MMNPVIRQLLDNIGRLGRELENNNQADQRPQTAEASTRRGDVEEEVSRAFRRNTTSSNSSFTSNIAASTSSTQQGSTNTNSARSPRFRLSYNFNSNNSRGRSYNRSGSKKGKPAKIPNGPFMKDGILLGGPEDNRVPRQGSRVWLMENGHVICGAQFMKEWDAKTLQDFFKSLFPSLGEFDDDVEVLMSVHSRLMAPVLAPGQVLTGFMVQKVFKDKPIYIRPSRHILDMEPLFKKAKLDSEVSS